MSSGLLKKQFGEVCWGNNVLAAIGKKQTFLVLKLSIFQLTLVVKPDIREVVPTTNYKNNM